MAERRALPPHRRAPERRATWVPWALAVVAAGALGFVGGGALQPHWLGSKVAAVEPAKCPEAPVCPSCPQPPAKTHAGKRMSRDGLAAKESDVVALLAREQPAEEGAEEPRAEKPPKAERPGKPEKSAAPERGGKAEKVARGEASAPPASDAPRSGRADKATPPAAAASDKPRSRDEIEEPFQDASKEEKATEPDKAEDKPPASIAWPEPSAEPAAARGKVRLGPTEEEARLRVWLAERAEALRTCSEQGRHGHGLLSLDVEQSGKVKKARLMAKEGIPASVERCILERARELRPPVKTESRLLVNLKM